MVRVLTLVVLAVSLYAGGWLYQQMSRESEDYHANPAVNAQLKPVKRLVDQGIDSMGVVGELQRQGVRRLGTDEPWNADLIDQIRRDYRFD